jgi:hypothetical protein
MNFEVTIPHDSAFNRQQYLANIVSILAKIVSILKLYIKTIIKKTSKAVYDYMVTFTS